MDDGAVDPSRPAEDDALVAELRRLAAEVDSVPDEVRAAAHAAITTRHLDCELAVLVADSSADVEVGHPASAFEQVRTGTAGSQNRRLLSFAGGGAQVDLELSDQGDRLDLIGQFSGASTEGCVLEYASGAPLELELDDLGRFLVSGARHGLVRARFRSAAGVQMITAWVTV
jgi:hypothetical protein